MGLGFNGARFHHRVYEDRSLYWADHMGYLVWGEYPIADLSGPQGFCDYLPELTETINQYYNHPAVISWICVNEIYHKMVLDLNVEKMRYNMIKTIDPFRPVIDASGGVYCKTDMFDVHDYEQDPEKLAEYLKPMTDNDKYVHTCVHLYRGNAPARPEIYSGQPYWISECGGTFWNLKNKDKSGWGYGNVLADEEEFIKCYEGLIKVMASHPRVCGFCYTQLTDIEQEQNGLFYYDRTCKFFDQTYERIRIANQQTAKIEK